jgi:hypothetical protein
MDYQRIAKAAVQQAIAIQIIDSLPMEQALEKALKEVLEEDNQRAIALEVNYLFGQDHAEPPEERPSSPFYWRED